jgi:prolyl oligopeptidase
MTRHTSLIFVVAAAFVPAAVVSGAAGATLPPIDGKAVLEHTKLLASDAFEGRAPGTKGEQLTVAYLTEQLKAIGLQPGNPDGSWVQKVPLVGTTVKGSPALSFRKGSDERRLAWRDDYVAWTKRVSERVTLDGSDVVFVGYGVQAPEFGWDDYKGVDLRGKTMLVLVGDPPVRDPKRPAELDPAIFGGRAMTYYGRWSYKYEMGAKLGAAAVLIVHETEPAGYPFVVVQGKTAEQFDLETKDGNASRSAVEGWITLEQAKALLAMAGEDFDTLKTRAATRGFTPVPLGVKASVTLDNAIRRVPSANVAARIEGSDPALRDEWVVYTTHWDHFGVGTPVDGDAVYHGAVDNATGCGGLLELARALAHVTPKPRRSVLFLFVTAEEQGLLGSAHYAAEPLYPLAKTLAVLNLDALNVHGRTRDLTIVGLGLSSLDDVIGRAAAAQGRVVKPDPTPEKGSYYRSDHFPFARHGVPSIDIGGGVDYIGQPADYGSRVREEYIRNDYHKPSDRVRPDWDMTGAVLDLTLYLRAGYEIAGAAAWPEWKPGAEWKPLRDEMLKAGAALRYPVTRKGDVVDDYQGVKVTDPYRWLEDLNAPETKAWIEAENAATYAYLDGVDARPALRRRLTELWDYPRTNVPAREAGRLFYRRNSGLEKQAPLYERSSLADAAKVLVDPNALSPDGSLAFAQWSVSPDGKYLAYGLAEGGADWQTIRIREVATGKDIEDKVAWFRFSSISWTKDGKGFFYARFPEPAKGQELSAELVHHQLFYHRVGTPQSEDRLIFERKDLPRWFVGGAVTEDGRYLCVFLTNGSSPKNRLFYADLGDPRHPRIDAPIVAIVDEDIAELAPIGNRGATLLLRTDLDAPKRKVIAIDLSLRTGRAGWKTIVPERENALENVVVAGGKIFADYLVDVKSQVEIFSLDGVPEGELALPGIGSVDEMAGREDGDELFYRFTSQLYPATVFRYDIRSKSSAPFEPPKPAFDSSRYETTQVFYPSKDGTRVPMFIVARKGVPRDGSSPAWLYGYGGFAISITPSYVSWLPAWLEAGGIYAVPSLRGGGEYGEEWHRSGMKEKKQNVFDDFVAAAEYLVRERYTSSARLVIEGGSNGGLLVGAVMTQRPELYAVALPAVGVMDMLRFDKFTGGAAWAVEYGKASDPESFPYLSRYSPLQNLKPGVCYPATLVTTADHDDRVVPSHSYKFIAALQAAQSCARPTLIRVETQGSHGYRPTDKQIAQRADIMAFVFRQLGLKPSTAEAAAR